MSICRDKTWSAAGENRVHYLGVGERTIEVGQPRCKNIGGHLVRNGTNAYKSKAEGLECKALGRHD